MLIEVTGKKFKLPEEALNIPYPYDAIAISLVGFDNYPVLKKKLYEDLDWAERILQRGPERDDLGGFAYVAGFLADSIHEPLELILNGRRPCSLGSLLTKGKIIVRGDLSKKTAHSMSGGYLFVDGNVEQISYPDGGVVYVRGNVSELDQVYRGVLVIAGEVGRVREGLSIWKTPLQFSPLIFTTQPVQLCREPVQESAVIDKSELLGWMPYELEEKSRKLCERRLNDLTIKELLSIDGSRYSDLLRRIVFVEKIPRSA